VEKPIQGECSRALDDYYQRQCDGQQMILNPVSSLGSEPVQEEAESKMNGCDSTHHRNRDDQSSNSAEQPDDQSDSTEQFPGDDQKGQGGRKVQMFGERSHAAGETWSAIPTQQFLSAVSKKYDSQYDASNPHNPVSVSTS
jgi:hypothetical protein